MLKANYLSKFSLKIKIKLITKFSSTLRRCQLMLVQWTPLNGITLGRTISDPFNPMIPITEHMSYKRMLLRGIRDLINLSHFDPIIRMIPLTVCWARLICLFQVNRNINQREF